MNNIYKVIWSKAKNCYVVASEIARSHTKSASGSEKIGGVTRRSLLASLMALSLLCGGLGVASAVDGTVHVDESSTPSTATEVYTTAKVDTLLNGKANTSLDNLSDAGKSVIKDTMSGELAKKADKTYVDNAITAAEGKIGDNTTAIGNLQAKDAELEGQINAEKTARENKDNELAGNIKTNADNIQNNKKDITTIKQRTAGIDRIDATKETTIEGNVTVDNLGNVTAKGKLIGDGVDAGSLNVENASHLKGDVTMDNKLSVTGDTKLGALNVTGESSLKDTQVNGTLTTTGKATFKEAVEMDKGLTVTSGDTTLQNTDVKGALNVTGESSLKNTTVGGTLGVTGETTLNDKLTVTGEATFKDKVTMEKDLEVKGELKTDKIAMENKKTDADGRHNSSTTITADYITHIGEVEKSGVTTKSSFTHNEEGSETYAMKGDKTDWTETRSDVKADGVKTEVKDSKGNRTNTSQTADGIKGYATDEKGNKTYTKVTATENSFQVQDKDGKNKNHQVNTKDSSVTEITNGDGKTTKTEQTATDIINTAKDGTIKNEANHIENTATTMKTTVTGQATEEFNGGLDTTVTGTENHTVNGKQINTIKNGQENIISGGQTNTITGDQTTTITGNKTETVTENVTEDYKKNLTTTVGGNEIHEVKGTKTETVEGKLTENFKGGQETNVTGDQTTNVSGTQTTTATDINRNASSGMIDTIDNDYGTNTETKVAGKTTTDVSIKGTGEKGQYIRGANESRDYLIKGTLKNSETKTAEATSTEITDGTNKASTIQDAKNLAGSVTNGTETGVSGIHANNDGSVSIDSSVAGGGMSSVINQKKDSIQSAVGDGTNSTVIHQDKNNVTIASSNGMVGLVGKDIVNNAQNTITNTAGTKITDTAGDSTVTTENGKGTTFTKTGSTAYREGGPTDTNISGNTITTGKVTMDYAEVMKDLGVTGKTTTGSLEVKGESKLTGNVTMENNATVGNDLTVKGITNTKTLNVTEDAKVGRNLSVDGNATIKGDVTARSYQVEGKTYIDKNGIHANGQKITDVADGSISEGSKDAVNGGQLYGVKNDLEGKVNKVGANAAAMANLHPMEFDPDSKWNIAAAIGNYGSETAAALGAFYRPNDDVMVNLSTAFGTGENMVGGGVSVRLGKGGNKLSREETNALKAQVADLTARMDALLSVLNPNMSKDFPDVPENHWAYEAVSRLAGNDIVQGYPDGEFHGERTMTRYEMAEIIYNALSRGAEAEKELVEEFKPELQAMAASEKATAEKAEG